MRRDISVKELIRKIRESEKTRTPEDRLRLLQEARILDSDGNFVKELFSEENPSEELLSSQDEKIVIAHPQSKSTGFFMQTRHDNFLSQNFILEKSSDFIDRHMPTVI